MNKTHTLQVYAYMWTWQDTASRCMGPCLESIAFVFDELLTSMCAKVFVSRRWPTGASQGLSPTTTTAETPEAQTEDLSDIPVDMITNDFAQRIVR